MNSTEWYEVESEVWFHEATGYRVQRQGTSWLAIPGWWDDRAPYPWFDRLDDAKAWVERRLRPVASRDRAQAEPITDA